MTRRPTHPIRKMARDVQGWTDRPLIEDRLGRHVEPLLRELERGLRDYYPSGPAFREVAALIAAWRAPLD